MKKTLLERAKESKVISRKSSKVDKERMELSLGWLKDEVSTKQINDILGYRLASANVLYTVAANLKRAYNLGMLKIVNKK